MYRYHLWVEKSVVKYFYNLCILGECRMDGCKMNKSHGIILFGANGSGKTTLGRELAYILNFKHMDHEDYHFKKSEIPYTAVRPYEDCLSLMLYDLAVFISVPIELRMERIEQRAYNQHGERIRKGGDMYGQHLKFIDFVASRSLSRIEQWAGTLTCPLIHVDGTIDWHTNAKNIAKRFYEIE